MPSYYVENFGCRATQADGAAIERELIDSGMVRADAPESAQVVVLNTCTVTASADQDVRSAIRRIHRRNPACRILVTGCYAQRAPQEIAALPGVSAVVGNSHKHQVAHLAAATSREFAEQSGSQCRPVAPDVLIADLQSSPEILVGNIFAHTELVAAPVFAGSDKTRPNLKVQDGCNNRCSFCIIPFVRGQSRSLKLDECLRQIDVLVASGFHEVVISGINLGRWGRDLDKPLRFEHLVRAIVERTSLDRLRISSVEPMDWSDDLIDMVASSSRIAKHAHVPMQSASDRVLRLMHRKYRPWHYEEKLGKIRGALPTAAIGADVMVGFPGETDADFEETRAMIERLPLTYLHVFTYSGRPGTPSEKLPKQVPVHTARERNRVLRELAAAKKRRFMESFLGEELSAITLGIFEDGFTEALTDNYLKLRVPGYITENQMIPARIERVEGDSLVSTVTVSPGGARLSLVGPAAHML